MKLLACLLPLVSAAQVAQLPLTYIDTSIGATPVTGESLQVGVGGDLQAAIDASSPGDEIVLQAGATFIGNFILRNKSGAGWITIRSSASGNLPSPGCDELPNANLLQEVGMKPLPLSACAVDPSMGQYMATIVTPNSAPAFQTEPAAHRYRLIGLEITVAAKTPLNYGLILTDTGNQTDFGQVPSDIIVDRDYVHGEVLCHCKSGIQLNVIRGAVINSYFSDFHGFGQDTQAIISYSTPGPLKIVGNFLEGAGETMMFGGAYSMLPGVVPSDIEIRWNHFFKPFAWMTSVIPAPRNVTVRVAPGGSAPPGKYWYSVLALGSEGYYHVPGPSTDGFSGLSSETVVTLNGAQSVEMAWDAVAYGDSRDTRTPDSYAVLRSSQAPGTPNRQWVYLEVQPQEEGRQSATDTGTSLPSWPLPGYLPGGYLWEAKNLQECKNCQRLLAEGNLYEQNWLMAQDGTAILFTPRVEVSPPGPNMYQNRAEDITFINNVIAHAASGISLLGYDYNECSNAALCQQSERVVIANNLLYDISRAYGSGEGRGFQFGAGEPGGTKAVAIDHNTLINDYLAIHNDLSEGSLTMNNNIFPTILQSDGEGSARSVLAKFSPWAFAGNLYVPGASDPAQQVPGNYYPADLTAIGFVDEATANYQLSSSSRYRALATDGSNPGVDIPLLTAATTVQACAYSIAPGRTQTVPNSGGTLTFSIDTSPACGWLIESGASWIQVQSPFGGIGSGSVTLGISSNQSTASRNSTLLVANEIVRIAQPGAAPPIRGGTGRNK